MLLRPTIKLSDSHYLKNPEETELGRNIVGHSILMIEEMGIEQFTFKKLAEKIGSTEASVYRYFENKHQLLLYLISWYWTWLNHRIIHYIEGKSNRQERLEVALRIISESDQEDLSIPHIDESKLHRIVVREGAKTYSTIKVDTENKDGLFVAYKNLCATIADIVSSIDAKHPYPHTLASTLLETAHQQLFFANHLPRLTDIQVKGQNFQGVLDWLRYLCKDLL